MNPIIRPDRLKILTAILIAVLIFLLGVGSATAGLIKFPRLDFSGFLPVVMNNSNAETTTSSGALIVFSSTATRDGNASGRAGMNDVCVSQDASSHFCSLPEIETAMMYRGVRFQSPFLRAWVDNPTLGTVIRHQATGTGENSVWEHDICNGWTSNNGTIEGIWIDDMAKGVNIEVYGGLHMDAFCSQINHVACCK
jgi:hypothetical protein